MIRRFKTEDTDAVMAVWQRAQDLAHPFLSQDVAAKVAADVRAIYLPNAETWVLERNGAPVGFIAMINTEIGGLFLDPELHGQGLGRRLVDHVVAAKGPLTVEVFKDNKIGVPFYQRYGFVQTGEGMFELSGDATWKMAMPGTG